MALILAFRAAEAAHAGTPVKPRPLETPAPASQSAELILFPGVRYERHAPEARPEPCRKSRSPRRSKPRELIDLMD